MSKCRTYMSKSFSAMGSSLDTTAGARSHELNQIEDLFIFRRQFYAYYETTWTRLRSNLETMSPATLWSPLVEDPGVKRV